MIKIINDKIKFIRLIEAYSWNQLRKISNKIWKEKYNKLKFQYYCLTAKMRDIIKDFYELNYFEFYLW